ncbi:hypothetical protein P3L10_019399 [Capsicum annuum]
MEVVAFTYNQPSSSSSSPSVRLIIKQQGPKLEYQDRRMILVLDTQSMFDIVMDIICDKFERLSINRVITMLHLCFYLSINDLYWYDSQFQGLQTHSKKFDIPLDSTMSYNAVYSVVLSKFDDWGSEEFGRNYRQLVIHDTKNKAVEIMNVESNKDLQYLKVLVQVQLKI